ncbi:hypothetical protein Tco_0556449 [Tanacetum coccineum]
MGGKRVLWSYQFNFQREVVYTWYEVVDLCWVSTSLSMVCVKYSAYVRRIVADFLHVPQNGYSSRPNDMKQYRSSITWCVKTKEDSSSGTSYEDQKTEKTSSAVEDFILLYLYLLGTLDPFLLSKGQEHAAVAQSQPSSSSPLVPSSQPSPTPPPITTPTPPPIVSSSDLVGHFEPPPQCHSVKS